MATKEQLYLLGADVILAAHFAFVVFVVTALIVIWIGAFLRWRWVRNFWFRLGHLLAMGYVVGESLLGIICPLTTWESELRMLAGGGQTYAGSWMQYWVHRAMFFDLSESTFTILYVVFFVLVVGSLWFIPPRLPWRRSVGPSKATD